MGSSNSVYRAGSCLGPVGSDGYMESEGALAYYRYLQGFFSKHALQKAPERP
ncbi:MAG: hypothetical protein VW579_07845 [Verrucomicrobiales bacterium]